MALPITVPFTFANATTTQNLSSLDADFATVYNAVNGIGNGTVSLTNVNVTGGNISNVTFSGVVTYPENGYQRNRIINGGMEIWQRGASGFTTINNYSADRWFVYAGTSLSAVAQSTDVPSGYKYSLSVNGTNTPTVIQRIESVNCTDLASQNVTVSFWAKQTVGAGTGSLSAALYYPTATDNYTSATFIGSSTFTGVNAWTQYTYTFTSISANAVNGLMLQIGATGSGASTFLITGVQLEVGTVATPFERRQYGQELMLCQRYYWNWASTQFVRFSIGYNDTTTSSQIPIFLPVPLRTTPTLTMTNMTSNGVAIIESGISISNTGLWITGSGTGLTVGATQIYTASGTTGVIALNSEL